MNAQKRKHHNESGELWWHSRANKAKHHFSIHADIIDLANMITEEFSLVGESMRVKELGKRIKTRTGEVYISTDHLPKSRQDDWKQSELRRRIHRRWKSSLVGSGISQARNIMSRKQIRQKVDADPAWPEALEPDDQQFTALPTQPKYVTRLTAESGTIDDW